MQPRMPQRPRTHVQESASRSALQNLIPDEWTISRVENDYGLDERVEIFEGGFATALGFWVQLKSTDEQELWKALAEPVAISALNYMSAQAEPVLLVRHHAPTDRLYGFWLHRRNVVLRNPDQKTVTLHWQETNHLTRAHLPGLQDEARRFRLFQARLDKGVTARVDFSDDLGDDKQLLLMALTSIMRRTIGPLTLQLDNSPTDVVIELRRQHVLVDMSIVSIHVDIPPAESVNDLARNAMLVAAACLSKLGRPDAAADLVAICRDAPLLVSEELALVLAGVPG